MSSLSAGFLAEDGLTNDALTVAEVCRGGVTSCSAAADVCCRGSEVVAAESGLGRLSCEAGVLGCVTRESFCSGSEVGAGWPDTASDAVSLCPLIDSALTTTGSTASSDSRTGVLDVVSPLTFDPLSACV